MTVNRRDFLMMSGVAISGIASPVLAAQVDKAGNAPAAPLSVEPAAQLVDPSRLRAMAVHDFLYSDRHRRLYPRLSVYLNGDFNNVGPFIDCLEMNMPVEAICDELGLMYRGDVWFATLLVHLHLRDGVYGAPLRKVEPPAELADQMAKLEEDWRTRNDPPKPDRWAWKGRKEPPPPTISSLEEEIEGIERLRKDHPELGPGLDRLIARRRDQIAQMSA